MGVSPPVWPALLTYLIPLCLEGCRPYFRRHVSLDFGARLHIYCLRNPVFPGFLARLRRQNCAQTSFAFDHRCHGSRHCAGCIPGHATIESREAATLGGQIASTESIHVNTYHSTESTSRISTIFANTSTSLMSPDQTRTTTLSESNRHSGEHRLRVLQRWLPATESGTGCSRYVTRANSRIGSPVLRIGIGRPAKLGIAVWTKSIPRCL